MGGVERRHPAVAEPGRRAEDPGARADDDRLPAEPARGRVEAADEADRLVLAAVGGAGGDVAAEQPALAQLGDVARQRARQRRAGALDEPEPQPRPRLRRGPGDRRQVAVERDHARRRLRAEVGLSVLDLDRLDRVLERGVVELHHVHALGLGPVEPAAEVDVDDVEAARAEPEVARLRVDDHLVADLDLPDQRRRPPTRERCSPPTSTVSGSRSTTVPRRSFSTSAHLGGEVGDRLADGEHLGRAAARRRSRRRCGCPRCRWRAARTRSRGRRARSRRCRRRWRPRAARCPQRSSAARATATAGALDGWR